MRNSLFIAAGLLALVACTGPGDAPVGETSDTAEESAASDAAATDDGQVADNPDGDGAETNLETQQPEGDQDGFHPYHLSNRPQRDPL
ncbi:hypothetical protein KHP62_02000 [Rhodobacteraceae bacterium NNCM2]|nr:hypothetical protein [Coraliihabitans acroporae]